MQFGGMKKLDYHEACDNIKHLRVENTGLDNELFEKIRLLKENDKADADYRDFLLRILSGEGRVGSHKRRIEEDDDDDDYSSEEECDPQGQLFIKSLKKHDKSYVLETEVNGLLVVVRYDQDSSSDEECDPEPRRVLRSAMKQKVEPSNWTHEEENQFEHDPESSSSKETKNLTCRKSRNKAKSEMVAKLWRNGIVPDSDYLAYFQTNKVVDDHIVCTYGGNTVVYELSHGDKKVKHDDQCSSDMEILDSEEMNNNCTLNHYSPRKQCDFREEIIAVLRKPYNREERHKLWRDIKIRKRGERHLDLRNGRERSYSVPKDAKSYLDHYPDLKRQLKQFKGDKPKRLNLLRGFFFWMQNIMRDGSFEPWSDAECLAINPGSC